MTANTDAREWTLECRSCEEVMSSTDKERDALERRVQELEAELWAIRTAGLYGTGPPTDEEVERLAVFIYEGGMQNGCLYQNVDIVRPLARAALEVARKR
jgi:hypothetical protein